MKKYILYGAGNNAEPVIRNCLGIYKFDCIVDADESKWGKRICNLEIKPTNYLMSNEYDGQDIIISVSNKDVQKKIIDFLETVGFKYKTNCFVATNNIGIYFERPGRVSGYIENCENGETIKSYDEASFLFKPKDKECMLRCVNDEYVDRYREVYQKCKQGNMFGKYIVNTVINDIDYNLPYKMILEHEYISPISYSHEWSPRMFNDYVLFMADMIKALAQIGLGLGDGHTLNATIHNGAFLFLDFGAIICEMTKGVTLIEYINTHIIPLLLFYKGQMDKAYLYLKNPGIQYTLADIRGYLDDREQLFVEKLYDDILYLSTQEDLIKYIDNLVDGINSISNSIATTKWMGYQNDEWDWSSDREKWSKKMTNVINMIEFIQPKSIVDLAGNMGWYGTYYHSYVDYSVIIDLDCNCVDYLWNKVRVDDITNVIPIKMSICSPTLGYYRDEMISSTAIVPWRQSAIKRFKSDLVLALAIMHHLVFSQQLTFEEVIEQVLMFSKRYIIIEFIEKTDQYIWNFKKEGFEWYTKENFEKILSSRCKILSTNVSTPEKTRTIYLCEKKER